MNSDFVKTDNPSQYPRITHHAAQKAVISTGAEALRRAVEKSHVNGIGDQQRMRTYFVYILSSKSRRLYIGVTSEIEGRLWQHKTKEMSGHAARYNIDRLVHIEEFSNVNQAIDREKQLKKWRREKKVALIEAQNPTWRDLSVGWVDDSVHPAD